MVSAKIPNYYTWRYVDEQQVLAECMKWEEDGVVPIEVYKINPIEYSNRACSCQAYKRECKHLTRLEEARATGKGAELWKWRWDPKNGWKEVDDIVSLDDLFED
jgi:hypothetical protein